MISVKTELFLVRNLLYSDWMRRFTESVFSPNTGKYGPEIIPHLSIFHAVVIFLKYILGCHTTSKVSTKKAAFQNSLVHGWDLLNQFGKQLLKEMPYLAVSFLSNVVAKAKLLQHLTNFAKWILLKMTYFIYIFLIGKLIKDVRTGVICYMNVRKENSHVKSFVWQKNITK